MSDPGPPPASQPSASSPPDARPTLPEPPLSTQDELRIAEQMADAARVLRRELDKAVIGQDQVIELLLIGLFSGSHCFMIGMPGLAKTLIVSSLAQALDLSFKRIQFTPDLMPTDIIGADVMQEDAQTGRRGFEFFQGPIFANIVLADEINRTPPKTQAALLEAMQERQVTAGGRTLPLDEPFFVLATQNPIEQEGTYPLPEAQLDRFMFSIKVEYPPRKQELAILKRTTAEPIGPLSPVLTGEQIRRLQQVVRRVPVGDHVFQYALDLLRRTRPNDAESPAYVRKWIDVGAGTRAGQHLILAAKARALMQGRFFAACEDVAALAPHVLRHRMVTNFNAEAERVSADDVIAQLLEDVAVREVRE